jgi:predicted SPOUT superfamily RNA methylase MTH1
MIGEIARTLAMYRVDEIIIYHDNKTDKKDSLNYLITNLQYLETPQYLRKTLFPLSESLTSAGLMNPLDASHHLRFDEWFLSYNYRCPYREGIVLNRPNKDGSWVNIGLKKECKINQKLEEKTRVTVKLDQANFNNQLKYYSGTAVSSNEPKEKLGLYWGYFIRVAECIDDIFNQSTYNDKYDLIIGIGDKGKDYRDHENVEKLDRFKRCLIFFGGTKGIEYTVDSDEKFKVIPK